MSKCDFNKFDLQIYWNRSLAWVLSCKLVAYFSEPLFSEHFWGTASAMYTDMVHMESAKLRALRASWLKCFRASSALCSTSCRISRVLCSTYSRVSRALVPYMPLVSSALRPSCQSVSPFLLFFPQASSYFFLFISNSWVFSGNLLKNNM